MSAAAERAVELMEAEGKTLRDIAVELAAQVIALRVILARHGITRPKP